MTLETPKPLDAEKIDPEVLAEIQISLADPRVRQLCTLYNGLCEGTIQPNVYDEDEDDEEDQSDEPRYSIADDPPTVCTEWMDGRDRCVLTISEEGLYFCRSSIDTGMDDRFEDTIPLRALGNISAIEMFCENLG